ncbi:MAG: PEP/pyruvate-binding domain-containing protein, partial [Bacteroidota bacterium]
MQTSTTYTQIGGKAAQLQALTQLGYRVPPWTVISWEELLPFIHEDGLAISIPSVLVEQVLTRLELTPESTTWLAVRSSAHDEDGAAHSFAGLFESYLYVRPSDLGKYIQKVWQSAQSPRVAQYRQAKGLADQQQISVIVQLMVDPEVSGVAFGANPVSGDTQQQIISAVWGLGHGLVSGALTADTFTLTNNQIQTQSATHTHAFVLDAVQGGMKKISLPADQKHQVTLSNAQILEVGSVLTRLEKVLGSPQDVEFAYAKGQLYLLQTRPITSLPIQNQGQKIVWDNSNIIESYPGVTTPLTFSFIIKMYEAVYAQLALLLGIKEKEVEANRSTFAHMLGLINGRVYYNLRSWFKLLALLPGYALNAAFMEKMMGVKERFELAEEDKVQLTRAQAWRRLAGTLIKMVRSLHRLPKERRKFQQFLQSIISEYQAIDFDKLSPEQLMKAYLRFEKVLVKEWKAPLVNDFFAMIYFGTLEKLIQNWQIGQNPNLHNDLHCGLQNIISTQPIIRLFEISRMIASNPEAQRDFSQMDSPSLWEQLKTGRHAEIY